MKQKGYGMQKETTISERLITHAEATFGIRAGIARLGDILKGFSHQKEPQSRWTHWKFRNTAFPANARAVLVMVLRHPLSAPHLDWWKKGNTEGNRSLMDISRALAVWLHEQHGRRAMDLPYHLEKGGIFLKDAAVLAGLGIVGRSNLFLHPEWGTRLRLRGLLIEGDLVPTSAGDPFSPCDTCEGYCHRACPRQAFPDERYSRELCLKQMESDKDQKALVDDADPDSSGPTWVIKYCRRCELACPVGQRHQVDV